MHVHDGSYLCLEMLDFARADLKGAIKRRHKGPSHELKNP